MTPYGASAKNLNKNPICSRNSSQGVRRGPRIPQRPFGGRYGTRQSSHARPYLFLLLLEILHIYCCLSLRSNTYAHNAWGEAPRESHMSVGQSVACSHLNLPPVPKCRVQFLEVSPHASARFPRMGQTVYDNGQSPAMLVQYCVPSIRAVQSHTLIHILSYPDRTMSCIPYRTISACV